jgi:hypothetical protein
VHTFVSEGELAGAAPSAVAARAVSRLLRCEDASVAAFPVRALRRALRGAAEDSISEHDSARPTVPKRVYFHTHREQQVAEICTSCLCLAALHRAFHAPQGSLACRAVRIPTCVRISAERSLQ